MFRNYENPKALEKQRDEVKALMERTNDAEELIQLHDELEDLIARINFAWQDDEYDEMCASF